MATFQSSALGVSCKEVRREVWRGKDRQLKFLRRGSKEVRYSRKGQWQATKVNFIYNVRGFGISGGKLLLLEEQETQRGFPAAEGGGRSAIRNLQCEWWVPRGPGTRQGEDPASCSWTEVPLGCRWTRLDPTWRQGPKKMTHVGLIRPHSAEITSDSSRSRSEP